MVQYKRFHQKIFAVFNSNHRRKKSNHLTKKDDYNQKIINNKHFFFICKFHLHPVGLKPTISLSTLLEGAEVPFELKLIGNNKDILNLSNKYDLLIEKMPGQEAWKENAKENWISKTCSFR
jgi:hypothetical protein